MTIITTIGLDLAKKVFQVHGVDAEGKRLFGTAVEDRKVVVFDFGRGKLIKEIAGVQEPRAVLYRSDLSKLYVSDGGGALRIFDSNTFAPPGAGVLRSPGPLNHGECQ